MAVQDIWPRVDAFIVAGLKALQLADPNAAPGDNANRIGNHVWGQLWPDDRDVIYPLIFVTHEGLAPRQDGGSSAYAEWILPNNIWIVDVGESLQRKKDLYLTWIFAIVEEFDGQRMSGITEVVQSKVIPMVTFDKELPQYQHVQSGLRIDTRIALPRRRSA